MINYDSLLSDQVKRMQPSGIRKFFDVAAMMEGVISLGVGEPDFQTPWVVRKEAVDILERKRIIYSANSGMMNLRKEIANYLNRKYDLTYDPNSEVIATVGGSEAIDLAIRAIVNPGDEVLVVEPSFVCYKPIVELMHGVAVPIPTKEVQADTRRITGTHHGKDKDADSPVSEQPDGRYHDTGRFGKDCSSAPWNKHLNSER